MNNMQEEWRPVPDTNGRYEVSNLGRVRRTVNQRIRKLARHNQGYSLVQVEHRDYPSGKLQRSLHGLVAEVFIGPRPTINGKRAVVCHNDGDPTNNVLSNLRYDTQSANMHESFRHGRRSASGEGHPNAKLNAAKVLDIRKRYDAGDPLRPIAAEYGVNVSQISAVGRRRRWRSIPEAA